MIWLALAILIATAIIYPRALLWALVVGLGWFGALVFIVFIVAGWIVSVIILLVAFTCAMAWQFWQSVTRRTA